MKPVKPIQIFCKWTTGTLTDPIVQGIRGEPNIEHIHFGRYVKNLWPTRDRFNFKPLIDQMKLFYDLKCRKFGVSIAFGNRCPDWFFDPNENPDFLVPHVTIVQENDAAPGTVEVVRQPIFWHENYIALCKQFTAALYAALRQDYLIYSKVSTISMTYFNVNTAEFRICAQESALIDGVTTSDSHTIWDQEGLKYDKLFETWRHLMNYQLSIFQDKRIVVPFINLLGEAFPQNEPLFGPGDINRMAVDYMAKRGVSKFISQCTVLRPYFSLGNNNIFDYSIAKGLRVGYQLSEQDYGDNQATNASFQAVLQQGYDLNGIYVQMHDNNATKYSYRPGIAVVRAQFPVSQ